MPVCKNCGAQVEVGHNFCPNCGDSQQTEKTAGKNSKKRNWPLILIISVVVVLLIAGALFYFLRSNDEDIPETQPVEDYYAVSFEVEDISAAVQVYADAEHNEEVGSKIQLENGQAVKELPDGDYWFTAKAGGYADYRGEFTVDGEGKKIEFEMDMKEFLYPKEEVNVQNLQGNIEYLKHDPASEEAYEEWYEGNIGMPNSELRVEMDEPAAVLEETQTLHFLLRRTDNSDRIPRFSIELYQDGVLIKTLAENVDVDAPEGEVYTYKFEPEDLEDISGADLELVLSGGRTGGPPEQRNVLEIGAIIWAPNLAVEDQ